MPWTFSTNPAVGDKIPVAFGTAFGAWTTYTPTLTGFTLGNGTVSGRYAQVGKLVAFNASFTFGSTSAAASAAPTLTLPVSSLAANQGVFSALFTDVGVAAYIGSAYQNAVGTISGFIIGASGLQTTPTTTTPFTWGTGDFIVLRGVYEAA